MVRAMETRARRGESGAALGALLLSGLLAVGIFVQILYLTKDLGVRADLTQDKLYSLSGSTKKVLSKLDKGLVIEAYFSADVPGMYQVDRQKIVDLLDEYEQMGGGKCRVVFYDPLEDESIREKAQRLGIQEAQATDVQDDSIRAVRFYQGLRIRYGGDEQKVLPLVQNVATVEGLITPKIRELVSDSKPKVGILKRAAPPANPYAPQQQPPDFTLIGRQIEDRFEVVQIDLSKGQLLAEDLALVIVVAPKDMTDWEKYQIDQHVMRGKGLIVLQEAGVYSVGGYDEFRKQPSQVDTADSKVTWKLMLSKYGADLSGKVVADMLAQMQMFALEIVRGAGGSQGARQIPMPYWFQTSPVDWKQTAGQLAKDAAEADSLRKTLAPGINVEHPLLDGSRGVTFFWPTEVGLVDPMPEGVEGTVLVRTSPLALAEDPPMSTAPREAIPGLRARMTSERRQIPLAIVLDGKFTSAWKGTDLPARPLPEKKDEKGGGLLAQGGDASTPAESQDEKTQNEKTANEKAASEKAQTEKGDAPKVEIPQPGQDPAAGDAKAGGAEQDTPAPIGPLPGPPQADSADEAEKMPARIDEATGPGRIVVIGDASFVRDDFLTGLPPYRLTRSVGGIQMLENAIDWLALDSDLIELRNKRERDRKLNFGGPSLDADESQEEYAARVASSKSFYRWLNILLPVIALLGLGLLLWTLRSAEKRSFLASTPR